MSSRSFVCVIDPLGSLNPKKDSSIAMLEAGLGPKLESVLKEIDAQALARG